VRFGVRGQMTASIAATMPIGSISFDFSTHNKLAPGSDNWPVTWSDDDHQYSPWGDGGGFGGTNSDGRVSFGVARVEGDYDDYVGYNRYGGKNPEFSSSITGKAHGAPISIGGDIYFWITPGSGTSGFASSTLYKSTNKCQTISAVSPQVQFTNSTHGVAYLGFVNHGKDNAETDGYCYVICAEITDTSNTTAMQDNLFLMRVAVDDIETQAAYEWFTGTSGAPSWGDIADRQPIYSAANGLTAYTQMCFVPGPNRYVLFIDHTGASSDFYFFEAPKPYGPWTLIGDFTNWGVGEPGSDMAGNMFQVCFAPRWIRNGGLDFTVTCTGDGGGSGDDSWNTVDGSFTLA
jgi:hypothetical protein